MKKTASQIADEVIAKIAADYLRAAVKGQKKTQRAIQAPAKLREPKSTIAPPKPKEPKLKPPAPVKPAAMEKRAPKPAKAQGVPEPKQKVEPVKAPEPQTTKTVKAPEPPKAPQLATRANVPPGYSKTTGPTEQKQPGAGYFNTRPGR